MNNELLINNIKSNNSEFKSNNEGKQIEEMALILKNVPPIEFPAGSRMQGKHIYSLKKFAEAIYNANFRKQEWISVDERLPEESCEVLTVDRTGVMYLAPYSDRYKAFNATDEDGGDRWKLTVTHWMPLPEAPKMKGGAE